MQASLAPSFAYDFRRALASPLRTWNRMRHWVQLARYTELPYLELMRYRRELHDIDHSYEAMSFEFELAWAKLEPGGLLLSDDSHLHRAWDDFCTRRALRPTRVEHLGVTRAPSLRRSL